MQIRCNLLYINTAAVGTRTPNLLIRSLCVAGVLSCAIMCSNESPECRRSSTTKGCRARYHTAHNGTRANRVEPEKWQASGKQLSGVGGQERLALLALKDLSAGEFPRRSVAALLDESSIPGQTAGFRPQDRQQGGRGKTGSWHLRRSSHAWRRGDACKHRAQTPRKIRSEVTTIGEWIQAARGVSASNPATFAQYAASLRLIAGQILSLKKTKKRFGPGKGGARAYRAGIDSASLEILSAQAVQRWRLAYVAQAKNPAQERSRMTSANSTLRQARSLFADKIVRFLPEVQLPSTRPFADVEFFPKQSARYFSRIDPKALLRAAQRELAEGDPPAFVAMLLAFAAGLRRGEIDSLAWHQIDFERN